MKYPILEWSGHVEFDDHFCVDLTIQFEGDEFVRHIYDRLLFDDSRLPIMAQSAAAGVEALCRWMGR